MSCGDDARLGIYLDDSLFSYELVALLVAGGCRVVTPMDAGLLGARDTEHFAYAAQHRLALLTKNPKDFIALHQARRAARGAPDHAGILAVYQDNDRTRDMTRTEIVRAVVNLFASGVPIADEVHTLNHWRF